jgi:hypothetical protein
VTTADNSRYSDISPGSAAILNPPMLRPLCMAQTTALKLVYLRSLGGTGYVAPTMALCIGCLRAVAFGEPRDPVARLSEAVCWVLLAHWQFCVGAPVGDATVWAMANKGLLRFEMSVRFGADHPLCNVAFRDFIDV